MFAQKCAASETCARKNRRRHTVRGFSGMALVAVLVVIIMARTAVGGFENLVVKITLNDEAKGDFIVHRTGDQDFLIAETDIGTIGIAHLQAGRQFIDGTPYLSLRSMTSLTFSFDDGQLLLAIRASANVTRRIIDLGQQSAPRQPVVIPRENSVFVNYGLSYLGTDPGGFQSFTATDKIGFHSGNYLFLQDSLYTKTDTQDHHVRLMTSLTYEHRAELQRFVVGDQLIAPRELGSTIMIGGIGVQKLYRIDPYFITKPLFGLSGTASLPSQVDLYIDGNLMTRQQVPPGAFELKNLNYYGGARTMELVIRDSLGIVQRLTIPAYFVNTNELLGRGVQEYGYYAGFLRQEYGIRSNEYGDGAFTFFHRAGIHDRLTIGVQGEGSEGVMNGGGGAAFLLGRAGILSFQALGSRESGRSGGMASVTHTFQAGMFGTQALLRGYSRDYATVAVRQQADPLRFEGGANVHVGGTAYGGLSLGYGAAERYSHALRQVTSVNYAKSLSRNILFLLTMQAVRETDTEYGVFITINYSPRRDLIYSGTIERSGQVDREMLQVEQIPPVGEGMSYRATAERSTVGEDTATTLSPFLQYKGPHGVYAVESMVTDRRNGTNSSYALSAAGSIVYSGGMVGFSRPVNDSFSFVVVDGVSDVRVLHNNDDLGATNKDGVLVIPTIHSYQHNQITIDPSNLPLNYSISTTNALLAPSEWSGACLTFDAKPVRAVTGMLTVVHAGKPVPLEYYDVSMAVDGRIIHFQTGKAGEFYIENTLPAERSTEAAAESSCRAIMERKRERGGTIGPGTYPATVEYQGQQCSFTITFPTTDDVMTDLGTVPCFLSPEEHQHP